MWLRTVRRARESHHRNTDTAQGQRPLLRQEHHLKARMRPRAKSCLGPTPG